MFFFLRVEPDFYQNIVMHAQHTQYASQLFSGFLSLDLKV